jgi:hypothetical protein
LFASVCDDQDACTIDGCNPDGTCKAPIPTNCNDSNGCTTDSCDPQTGACINTPRTGATCDDTNDCTGGDACTAQGTCVGSPIAGCCLNDEDCDDSNQCTTDTCNLTTKTCSNTTRSCDDANPCTTDSCNPSNGACVNISPSLPRGTYDDTCVCCTMCGTTLTCICADRFTSGCDSSSCTEDEGCHQTSLNIASCPAGSDISNRDGSLSCP